MRVRNGDGDQVTIVEFSREEFLAERWRYRPGQHVTILAPTDGGKTTFAYQLLERTARPELPVVSLVMKPRDATVKTWSDGLGYRTVRSWPPTSSPWAPRKPAGYALWPKHTFDPEVDDVTLYQQFRKAISDSYKRGNRILFADEVAGLTDIWLERHLKNVWQRGRSMGCALWAASQRPFNVPLDAYSNAEHLFLGNDPDERSRKRYGEIGGVDVRLIQNATKDLPKFSWLYLRREGRVLCIVGP